MIVFKIKLDKKDVKWWKKTERKLLIFLDGGTESHVCLTNDEKMLCLWKNWKKQKYKN